MSGQSAEGRELVGREFLVRRNALWAILRALEPGVAFEEALAELSALIGWNRARILAGLGLSEQDLSEQDVPDARTDAGPQL
ncbi:hypothetical protein [Deinococcus sp. QL22]|uniref:hypothetical protein n=1 Tax=Deinococcus sp. QL22 TaxID=2939437 RepID=UPI002016A9F5|nr:hypothetical protein [Deinococcus sp. QL22]UQN05280.1 hypothetical protein M1R55_10315 [Deinococcus sp. QL22]